MERFGQAVESISAHYAAKDARRIRRCWLDKVGAIKSCHVDSFERTVLERAAPSHVMPINSHPSIGIFVISENDK